MKRSLAIGLVMVLGGFSGSVFAATSGFFSQLATDIDGKAALLSKFSGKVVLVVNTASQCGFTPQYEGLQKLHARFEKQGFTVLGFPSNDFFGQEPGTNQDIKLFCEKNYRVSFPLFAKARVKGSDKQPVYRFLTEESDQEFRGEVGWNFEKFLVDRQGKVIARFKSRTSPEDPELVRKIEQALAIRSAEGVQRK